MDTFKLDEIIDEIVGEYLVLESKGHYRMSEALSGFNLQPLSPERAYVRIRVARRLSNVPSMFPSEKYMPEYSTIIRK